jgi:hypothetical protein
MPRNNPVRGQYRLVGTDLIRAGIRPAGGKLAFVAENTNVVLPSIDPGSELWITSRAVSAACAKVDGLSVNMGAVPLAPIAAALRLDPLAGFRQTADHIVHMLGGESKANRAYANLQVAELVATYSTATKAAA